MRVAAMNKNTTRANAFHIKNPTSTKCGSGNSLPPARTTCQASASSPSRQPCLPIQWLYNFRRISMSNVVTLESVEALAAQLPPAQRLQLAHKLLSEAKRLERQSLPEVTWESVHGI